MIKYGIFYSNSKAWTIINESDTDNVFESIYIANMSNIKKNLVRLDYWFSHTSWY